MTVSTRESVSSRSGIDAGGRAFDQLLREHEQARRFLFRQLGGGEVERADRLGGGFCDLMAGQDGIARELRKAVLGSVDSIFLAAMNAGVTPTGPTGSILGDLEALVAALDPDSGSRLFLVLAPSVAAHLAFTETTGGQRALPGVNVNGGEVGGVRVVVSDYLPGGGSPVRPVAMMLDASQLVLASDDVGLRVAEHASVVMDNAPGMSSAAGSPAAPVAAQMVSLWQDNLRGVMVERRIGYAFANELKKRCPMTYAGIWDETKSYDAGRCLHRQRRRMGRSHRRRSRRATGQACRLAPLCERRARCPAIRLMSSPCSGARVPSPKRPH